MIESRNQDSGPGWFINHLPTILWHRKLIIIVSFVVLLIAGLVAAFSLPTVYRSTANLLVQSQELPTELVNSPATAPMAQRIAQIRQRVLSRRNLVELIEQNDLYPEERRSQPAWTLVDTFRTAVLVGSDPNTDTNDAVILNMSFDYPDAAKAQTVLQSLVSETQRMYSEDLETQAVIAVRFLQDQAIGLQGRIRQVEGQLTALKARNGVALASGGVAQFIDTGTYSAQIATLENENKQLMAAGQRPIDRDPQVVAAEIALATARSTYSDTHPDVVQARERLEVLRRTSASAPARDDVRQAQIAANNAAISTLTAARNSAIQRANTALASQARAPAILEEAMQLESKASALRQQHQDVATRLMSAQNSARMTLEQRGERLLVVEPPSLPGQPQSPNRPLIILGGAVAGLALGLLLALGSELALRPLRSPSQLTDIGSPVLGVVPIIASRERSRSRRLFRFREKRVA